MEQTSILTHKNMETMLNWLTGVENVRPEFAEPFMTTLHLLYMNKSETDGVPPPKIATRKRRQTLEKGRPDRRPLNAAVRLRTEALNWRKPWRTSIS